MQIQAPELAGVTFTPFLCFLLPSVWKHSKASIELGKTKSRCRIEIKLECVYWINRKRTSDFFTATIALGPVFVLITGITLEKSYAR